VIPRNHLVDEALDAATDGDPELLRRLVDHAIARHFPALAGTAAPARALLDAVVEAQARLIASWMLLGFVHGVMNTDNTTISGETIDYGPCAFIDAYEPAAVFSSIDHAGRYAYGNQPAIGLWNLTRFAETLLPLLDEDPGRAKAGALDALERFSEEYERAWADGFAAKLGIAGEGEADAGSVSRIATGLLDDLGTYRLDFTGAFRALGRAARGDDGTWDALFARTGGKPGGWFADWKALSPDADAMDRVNPIVIPRNHLVDEALDAATDGDPAPFERLLDAVSHPYDERPGFERYAAPAPPGSGPFVSYCGT